MLLSKSVKVGGCCDVAIVIAHHLQKEGFSDIKLVTGFVDKCAHIWLCVNGCEIDPSRDATGHWKEGDAFVVDVQAHNAVATFGRYKPDSVDIFSMSDFFNSDVERCVSDLIAFHNR